MAHATPSLDDVLNNTMLVSDLVDLMTENEIFNASIMKDLCVIEKAVIVEKADGYSQTSPFKLSDLTNKQTNKRIRDENYDEDGDEDEDEEDEKASSSLDKAKARFKRKATLLKKVYIFLL